jgi:RNA polymerase sigma-70 factor (ECF subfamily)
VATALTTTMESRPAAMQGLAAEEFDEIVRRYQRQVYRVLFLLTRDAETADILTQETFLRAYKARGTFRGECAAHTWLLQIATNLARDYARSRRVSFWKRLIGLEDTHPGAEQTHFCDPQPSPERMLIARKELEAVWQAALDLPQRQRAIFLLRFAEDMPLSEIADVLRLRVGSVKTHLFRAIGSVREKMKEQQWR